MNEEVDWLKVKKILLYEPMPKQMLFHTSLCPRRALFGGNRCCGGETLIYDPVLCVENRIDSITKPFHVYAWDGVRRVVAEADKPFHKEVDKIYEVKLSNGKSFTCSLGHTVLTSYGYRTMYDVLQEYGGVLRASISEYDLKARVSDVRRSLKRVVSYPIDCLVYQHLDDGLLLALLSNDQGAVPSQCDAQEHISFLDYVHADGQDNKEEHNHPYQSLDHRSNLGVLNHSEDQGAGNEYRASCTPCISTSDLHSIEFQPTLVSVGLSQSIDGLALQDNRSYSTTPSDTSYLVITSIVYKRDDVKWDFTVPVYHNYECAGIYHHNTGKTTAGGMELLYHITGMYPDWYPEDKKLKGPVKGRIITKDFQKGTGEVVTPFLDEWLDSGLISRKIKNPMGIPTKYELKNGSVFDILTHEQTTEQFEGWRGHIAWFDEPPPRDKYVATLRGLVDYSGRHWLTLTPLTQPWIYDEIYTSTDKKYTFVTTVDIRENRYLTEQSVKEFEDSLTLEEKEARLHGRFLHLTGLIYKEFDAAIHVIEPPEIKKHWTRYMAIDPHERNPTAVLWLAVDEKDNHWVYDELWLKDMDVKQMAEAIQVQEGQLPATVKLIDPHADKDNVAAGGFNVRKELMRYGVFCQRANSDPMLGKARIRQALTPRFSPLLQRSVPQLRISKYCTQTIYEFQHYIWDEYRRNKEEYEQKETVKKKNDHFMDALRYIYNFTPRYQPPDEETEEVGYVGKYTKSPVMKEKVGSYHSLVEERAGRF